MSHILWLIDGANSLKEWGELECDYISMINQKQFHH